MSKEDSMLSIVSVLFLLVGGFIELLLFAVCAGDFSCVCVLLSVLFNGIDMGTLTGVKQRLSFSNDGNDSEDDDVVYDDVVEVSSDESDCEDDVLLF